MFVEQIMSRNVDTTTAESRLSVAVELMQSRDRRLLPVVDHHGALIGILSRSEVRAAEPSAITTLSVGEANYLLSRITVGEVMVKTPQSCSPDTLMEQAGKLMRHYHISSLPVVADGRLVGIITLEDILDFMLDITGANHNNTRRVAVWLEDKKGELSRFLNKINSLGGFIATVVSPQRHDNRGQREAIVHYRSDGDLDLTAQLQQEGYQLIDSPAATTVVVRGASPGREGSLAERIAGWIERHDNFSNLLGIEIEEVREGYCRASMVVRSDMLNSVEMLHGGATFSLADCAFAVASNSHNTIAVGLDAHISYPAAGKLGDRVTATATELKLGKRTALYQVEVRNGDDKLLAHFTGNVFRRDDTMSEWMQRNR
ncbi:MAG: hotdog fold thioesterase [Gammaproteobacteria bacterium]|nr:hotdog fold thioesterase [Gammaproteobacteria bacterium]